MSRSVPKPELPKSQALLSGSTSRASHGYEGDIVKATALGRKGLRELASIVTPETILRWYRELIASKYDETSKRKSA